MPGQDRRPDSLAVRTFAAACSGGCLVADLHFREQKNAATPVCPVAWSGGGFVCTKSAIYYT